MIVTEECHFVKTSQIQDNIIIIYEQQGFLAAANILCLKTIILCFFHPQLLHGLII